MKLTPVLLVDSVEKSLPFWIDRMGWSKTVEVPDGDVTGFAMLENGGAELMLQTFASAKKDEPKFVTGPGGHQSSVFIEVDDFEDVLKRLQGYEITMPDRTTFYGMREVGVFEPNGHAVVFGKRV